MQTHSALNIYTIKKTVVITTSRLLFLLLGIILFTKLSYSYKTNCKTLKFLMTATAHGFTIILIKNSISIRQMPILGISMIGI